MYGDFTRDPLGHAPEALYPFAQQGRVHLESDWNELATGMVELVRSAVNDMLGGSAAMNKGFLPTKKVNAPITFEPGAYFVDGLRVSWGPTPDGEPLTLANQPWRRPTSGDWWPDKLENAILFVDAWIRNVTYLSWPDIREEALRGPDTTTRGVLTWQIHGVSLNDLANVKLTAAKDVVEQWTDIANALRPERGKLYARVDTAPSNEPCLDDGPGGYTGPGNHLYRFEIDSGSGEDWLLRWSRDNAAVEWSVLGIDGGRARIGGRPGLRPQPNQWLELVDEVSSLDGTPNPAYRVRSFDPDNEAVVVEPGKNQPPWPDFDTLVRPRLRAWDGVLAIPKDEASDLVIERGILVQCQRGAAEPWFRPGDYWLAPARSNGSLIWPDVRRYPDPAFDPVTFVAPSGPVHHLAPLAFVGTVDDVQDARWRVELTRLTT